MLQGKEGVAYEGLGFVLLLSEIHAANSFFTQCCAQQLVPAIEIKKLQR
jgi:hypothetical protein